MVLLAVPACRYVYRALILLCSCRCRRFGCSLFLSDPLRLSRCSLLLGHAGSFRLQSGTDGFLIGAFRNQRLHFPR